MVNDVADVCIIGAGAAGSVMAAHFALRGIKVVLIEAGPRHDVSRRPEYVERFLRGEDPYVLDDPRKEAYVSAGQISYPLNWYRVKAVGGSTLKWVGNAPRLFASDFRARTLYGIGRDWPITYDELEPYYVRAERELGVAGATDNPWASYRSAPFPLPAFPFSYADRVFKEACDKLGIKIHTMPQARNSIPYGGRPQCCSANTCSPMCPIGAKASTDLTHIPLAERTGNLRLITGANVLRVELDEKGRAARAVYAGHDKVEHAQRARVFVIAAHAVESARLLLLSRQRGFPDGLGNESGLVGKGFMEHPFLLVFAKLKRKAYTGRGPLVTARSDQFSQYDKNRTGRFALEFSNDLVTPLHLIARQRLQGEFAWGDKLHDKVKREFGYEARIGAIIEQLPDERNSVTLDPTVKDYWGNPAPRITLELSEHERKSIEEARSVMRAIFAALDAEITREELSWCAHQLGTCRMGKRADDSVVDPNLRVHNIRNLFVVGSGAFPTGATANPTLTIVALALRAVDFICEAGRRGEL